MSWTVFFAISVGCLVASVIMALTQGKTKYRSGKIIDSTRLIFVGVAMSAVVLFIPICYSAYSPGNIPETILLSIYNTIGLFVVAGDFSVITGSLAEASPVIFRCYTVLFAILYAAAPVMTFGFVLSFFKNTSAYKRYVTHFKTDAYIFSKLNEKSLALADSLLGDKKPPLLVFTDVWDREDTSDEDLIDKAKSIGAVCFATDVLATNFSFHSGHSTLNFFMIDEDETENLENALRFIDKYRNRDNTNLYVFSDRDASELLLTNAFNTAEKSDDGNLMRIKVRRINEVRSLVCRTLYEDGYENIFSTAVDKPDGKHIHALVVGMGRHGTEMTKALSWFCQMDGYIPMISCVDLNGDAEDKFASLCPELMDPALNGRYDIPGEMKNHIQIHSSMDVDSSTFDKLIRDLPQITYIFVALGNDEKNISVAVKLRMLTQRKKYYPAIQAVISNTEKREALTGIVNFKNQAYDIQFIGDMKDTCSEKVILGSELEKKALERHLKWGQEKQFWQFDYNYRSSIASAIHGEMKHKCGIPGIEKAPAERTEDQRQNIRILEHRRWNAYMRSEGYVYSGSTERSSRDDLAKTHNCLVAFEKLPLEEQVKDDD